MTDYVQLLQAAEEDEDEPFAIPGRLRSTFQSWIERRNDIVHQGVDPPDPQQIEELLHAADEFLHMLGWASGRDWQRHDHIEKAWRAGDQSLKAP
jgi:hypothetical protein